MQTTTLHSRSKLYHNSKPSLRLYLRWQFSLDNSLNVGDNILGRLGGAVEVGDVALRDTFALLLHGILLVLLVEIPLEAALARIKSNNRMQGLIL